MAQYIGTVLLQANRPLAGNYGHVHPGATFLATEQDALELESKGLAMRPYAAPQQVTAWTPETFKPTYSTKVVVPEQPPVAITEDMTKPRNRR
jgi:hypothetical protein